MSDDVAITRSFWLVTHADLRSFARIEALAGWLPAKVSSLGYDSRQP